MEYWTTAELTVATIAALAALQLGWVLARRVRHRKRRAGRPETAKATEGRNSDQTHERKRRGDGRGPLQLTDYGKRIARALDARALVTSAAEEIGEAAREKAAHDVDRMAEQHLETRLGREWEDRVSEVAYEFGTGRREVLNVVRVMLRNHLLRSMGRPAPNDPERELWERQQEQDGDEPGAACGGDGSAKARTGEERESDASRAREKNRDHHPRTS